VIPARRRYNQPQASRASADRGQFARGRRDQIMSNTILVVDDNFDATEIAKAILTARGYEVRVVHSGSDALLEIGTRRPALVVLDVMMPDMSGMEVLDRIKQRSETEDVPVIMCTAKSHDRDVLDGYRSGADYYISKPFTAQQLLYGVELLLGPAPHTAPKEPLR
jgi:DNA-binding response OmpR family regulator